MSDAVDSGATGAKSAPPSAPGGADRRSVSEAVIATVEAYAGAAPPGRLHLSPPVAAHLAVADGAAVTLRAGGNEATVYAHVASGARSDVIRVCPAVLSRIGVPSGIRLHVRGDGATVELGPFVGILALRTRGKVLFGELDPYFRALTRQGRQLSVPAFMFSPSGVDWAARHIVGYTYSTGSPGPGWRRSVYPFPDVVYDRIQTRRIEGRSQYAHFRSKLAQHVTTWFNEPGFFDKWRLHRALVNDEAVAHFLPETLQYRSAHDLEHILMKYRAAFLKPVGGSLGLGIIRVRRGGSGFSITYEPGERVLMRRASTVVGLHRIVQRLTRGRPYIVQQGLPLATWNGRSFDIRVLMQRTENGTWAITKMFSRIGAPGSITSNLSRGADACNIHLLLRRVFRAHRRRLLRQLHEVAFVCARRIEQTTAGIIGELGLDLGVSRNGRIWLIEANSKPFLQMNREAGSPRSLALSVRRPLQFVKHLTGY